MHSVAIPIIAIILLFLAIIGIVIAGLWLMRKLMGKSPEEEAREEGERSRLRLLSPQWPQLEQRFRRPIPKIIRDLYAEHDLITLKDLNLQRNDGKQWLVADFIPADPQSLELLPASVQSLPSLPIARDNHGDVYYIPLNEGSYPVRIFRHVSGESELVAASLLDFMTGLERARQNRS